jgi:8-oxo-dGTP pyrophosphatase MutT (NUDIX family)
VPPEPAVPPDRLLRADDPELAPSRDPQRSRQRLAEARWSDAALDLERDRVLELLDEHGDALADRTTAPGHLTGSALVVDSTGERMVVLLHTKLRRWLQPGGHADGDHELAGVALREATEETGIDGLRVLVPAVDLDVHAVDHGDALGEHLHLDLRFVVVAPPDAVIEGNHESLALRWVSIEELEELADEEGLVRLARAGLRRLRDTPST